MKSIIFLLALALQAQSPTAPTITLEEQLEWMQARAEIAESRAVLKAAEERMHTILNSMQAKCKLALNDKGRPECAKETK